jgi:hypothetical protein
MEMVAAVASTVMMIGMLGVVVVALVPWLRAILRDEDDAPGAGEPSPVDLRALPYVLLTASSVAAVRELRQVPWSVADVVLPAAVLGFGISAAWYLLRRRDAEAPTWWPLAVVVALVFGGLWGLAPA